MTWADYALVFLALGTAACADETSVERQQRQGIPPETVCNGAFRLVGDVERINRKDVEASMARWNRFLGLDYFVVRDDALCTIEDGKVPEGAMAHMGGVGTETKLVIDPERLFKANRLMGPRLETLLMHELGHSMELKHLEGGAPGIMAPNGWTVAEDFTEADRDQCRRAGFCR